MILFIFSFDKRIHFFKDESGINSFFFFFENEEFVLYLQYFLKINNYNPKETQVVWARALSEESLLKTE